MKDLLKSLGTTKTKHAKTLVDSFFNEVSLCGPRIVDQPGAKDETKLCELFIPYRHAMTEFYNLIELLFVQPMIVQESTSFLESMEALLRKRQLIATKNKKRLGKNTKMHQIMQAKPAATKPKAEQQCKHAEAGTTWTSDNLKQMKKSHCTGYTHIDLSNTDVKNIAIYYLENDLSYDSKTLLSLKHTLRYDIEDDNCPAAPLFTPKDISIQQVAMDTLGIKKEWVAVVNLNTKDRNGYLQSEFPYCKVRKYLIGAKTVVKAYIDDDGCCDGLKDYKQCQSTCDEGGLAKLKDKHDKHYSKDIVMKGTQYKVENALSGRRRRLLQESTEGC
jgi:hypothetical protein